jgi:hypothetical protein
MSPHEPSHSLAGIPLKAHVEELRRRCEAVARLQGGSTYIHEELGIFRAYTKERGLILQVPPTELNRAPDSGWLPFEIEGNLAFFDPERKIVISDTHRGNIILMADGLLAPIDLRVQPLSDSLLDTITKLCCH